MGTTYSIKIVTTSGEVNKPLLHRDDIKEIRRNLDAFKLNELLKYEIYEHISNRICSVLLLECEEVKVQVQEDYIIETRNTKFNFGPINDIVDAISKYTCVHQVWDCKLLYGIEYSYNVVIYIKSMGTLTYMFNYDDLPSNLKMLEKLTDVEALKYILVKSDDELKQVFAPIDSEEESISYVSIITGTYPIYDFGYINMKYLVENFEFTNALRKENGFETVTFDYDIFCCPPHKYNLTRCFVDFNGNVKVLRRYAIGINVDDNNCND